ncbi:unnamed protein product [Victoria cruziana]
MSAGHRWGGERDTAESWVVSSPRRLLSFSRSKGRAHFSVSDSEEKKAGGFEHGTKPSEVYGFVGSISTVVATVIFLAWAYTPEHWLQYVGITYYPSRYWALAVPTYIFVTIFLAMGFYVGLNFMITPPPSSLSTIFDEYTREPSGFSVPCSSSEEQPIQPISDIPIYEINAKMFG